MKTLGQLKGYLEHSGGALLQFYGDKRLPADVKFRILTLLKECPTVEDTQALFSEHLGGLPSPEASDPEWPFDFKYGLLSEYNPKVLDAFRDDRANGPNFDMSLVDEVVED